MTRWAIMLILATASAAQAVAAEDRLQLDQTNILGNRELPRVTFVTPWRDVNVGAPDWQLTRNIKDLLAPLDRETLRLEIDVNEQLHGRAAKGTR